jgi:hypothetical protein
MMLTRSDTTFGFDELLGRAARACRRSRALAAWSLALVAQSRVLTYRPRGGSDANETRTERTISKARRGALPTASGGRVWIAPGAWQACNGCGEAITPEDREYEVEVSEALTFRFHAECHRAWSTFAITPGPSMPPAL